MDALNNTARMRSDGARRPCTRSRQVGPTGPVALVRHEEAPGSVTVFDPLELGRLEGGRSVAVVLSIQTR